MEKIMKFKENDVEVLEYEERVLFNARHVGECLDLGDSSVRKAIAKMNDKQVVKLTNSDVKDFHNRKLNNTGENFLTESGVYKLILRSNKPEAEQFQDWVTDEVLPTIRKTGGYVNDDDLFVNTYLPFADETTKTLFKGVLATTREQNNKIQQQQKEITYKENIIIGLVDSITLAEKRQILNRVVRRANGNFQERWRELYKQFDMKYHCDIKRRVKNYNEKNNKKVTKLDYIDKVMSKLPELYEIACKLYENDVKELLKEMYELNKKELLKA